MKDTVYAKSHSNRLIIGLDMDITCSETNGIGDEVIDQFGYRRRLAGGGELTDVLVFNLRLHLHHFDFPRIHLIDHRLEARLRRIISVEGTLDTGLRCHHGFYVKACMEPDIFKRIDICGVRHCEGEGPTHPFDRDHPILPSRLRCDCRKGRGIDGILGEIHNRYPELFGKELNKIHVREVTQFDQV